MAATGKGLFLRIPPEFGTYAEENSIYQLFEVMVRELVTAQPKNPLEFWLELLSKETIDGMRW